MKILATSGEKFTASVPGREHGVWEFPYVCVEFTYGYRDIQA